MCLNLCRCTKQNPFTEAWGERAIYKLKFLWALFCDFLVVRNCGMDAVQTGQGAVFTKYT